jgi:hypothetical protein
MKYIITLVLAISFSASTFSQARLTEIFPAGNSNNQYFELYNFGSSLANLKMLVRYKKTQGQSVIDSGFYVFSFPANATNLTQGYWYAAQSPNSGGGNSVSYANANFNYGTTPSIKRYSQMPNVPSPSADTTVALFSNSTNYIFLVNGNNIVDYMVSGPNSNAVAAAQAEINSWAPFVLGADIIRFSGVQLFKQYVPGQSSGNNAFYLESTSASCQTTSASPWKTTSNLTPGQVNPSSLNPVGDYWEQEFRIPTTADLQTYGNTFEQVNNVFPTPTYALNNYGSPNYAPTKMYFQVSLNNTNIIASQFANQTKGIIRIYSDVDNSNSISSGDINVTGNAIMTFQGLTAKIELNLTSNMFTQMASFNKLNRLLFSIINDNNGCFETRNAMNSSVDFLLPVSLNQFRVNNANNKNRVVWSTATETNNKGFEIQRSIGNTSDFRTIGFVGTRAKDGNSQTDINYFFDDLDVKMGQTHYYRLKQIDFDGKFSLSPVRSIKPGSIESNLNVYPNPSQGSVTVTTGSSSGKLNIYVVDNTGRTINQYLNVSTSSTRINNLRKGFYTLKIVNTETGEQSAQRLLVQ